MFEKTVAMPVQYEMLSCAPWRQNLLLADSYGAGPRVSCRRCGASGDPDRRARHEQRRRRRHRSVVEACRDAARDGAGRGCSPPTRSSAGKSARATSRPRAMPRAGGAPGARPTSRTSATTTPEGADDARQSCAHCRCRAAQEQRDDRRRARLPLCRLAGHLAGGGRGAEPQFHELRADHLAGRAPAACLARRRHGAA